MKVLIVDDSSMVRQQVRAVLVDAGHDVVEAGDGLEGLERLASCPDVAVMVVDINMPRMNGIELLVRLQEDKRSVPAIVLTTEGQPALIKRARAAGASGWMVKPFKPALLLQAVNKLGGEA